MGPADHGRNAGCTGIGKLLNDGAALFIFWIFISDFCRMSPVLAVGLVEALMMAKTAVLFMDLLNVSVPLRLDPFESLRKGINRLRPHAK